MPNNLTIKILFTIAFVICCFNAVAGYNADAPGAGTLSFFLLAAVFLFKVCTS